MKNRPRTSTKKNKSGRKQNKQAKVNAAVPPTPPAPPTPVFVPPSWFEDKGANSLCKLPCNHGMPDEFPRDLMFAINDCFDSFMTRAMKTLDFQKWMGESYLKHPRLFEHPQLAPFLLGLTTQHMLEDCDRNATMCMMVTIYLITMGKEKNHSFETESKINKRLNKHLGSKQDIMKYADRKSPCTCLTHVKEQVFQHEEIRTCGNCHKRMASTQLECCSLCKLADYCSKECQHADWPLHKIECKMWRGRLTPEEANKKFAGKGMCLFD